MQALLHTSPIMQGGEPTIVVPTTLLLLCTPMMITVGKGLIVCQRFFGKNQAPCHLGGWQGARVSYAVPLIETFA